MGDDDEFMVALREALSKPLPAEPSPKKMYVAGWQLDMMRADLSRTLGRVATVADVEQEAARVLGERVEICVYADPA